MTDPTPGVRVTVNPDIDRYGGQHGTVVDIDPLKDARPARVRLDGETCPRLFGLDEIGPYTGPACDRCGNTTGRFLTANDAGGRQVTRCARTCKKPRTADNEHSGPAPAATEKITGGAGQDGGPQ